MESATTQSEPKKTLLAGFYSTQEARNRRESNIVSVYAMKAYMGSRSIVHTALLTATLGGD
jgi:hypothetical protein